MFLYPSTVTDAEPLPPEPRQLIENELFPAMEIVTASEPEVPVWLVQLAEQEVALVDDQVRVEVFVKRTDEGSAERFTDAAGVDGAAGAPPPPPPPPHDEMMNKHIKILST